LFFNTDGKIDLIPYDFDISLGTNWHGDMAYDEFINQDIFNTKNPPATQASEVVASQSAAAPRRSRPTDSAGGLGADLLDRPPPQAVTAPWLAREPSRGESSDRAKAHSSLD
jgi:hypothetical protein